MGQAEAFTMHQVRQCRSIRHQMQSRGTMDAGYLSVRPPAIGENPTQREDFTCLAGAAARGSAQ
jgi:hypothetical protein